MVIIKSKKYFSPYEVKHGKIVEKQLTEWDSVKWNSV